MKQTIGVFAHVDAGKTTFCESLLYEAGQIAVLGRVDHQSATMDHHEIERRRGITVFSGLADFTWQGKDYVLIDTPGHVDFSAEMERVLSVLDAAIVLVSVPDGVQSHTVTIFRLLRARGIPVFFFLNKLDQPGTDLNRCMAEIETRLCAEVYLMTHGVDTPFTEWLCERDEVLLSAYLEERLTREQIHRAMTAAVAKGAVTLAFSGSALRREGIRELITAMGDVLVPTAPQAAFGARVFQVQYDKKGNRVTFLKCTGGSLQVREVIPYSDGQQEKIHEIRSYFGERYQVVPMAVQGDLVGVTGLTAASAGMGLGACEGAEQPVLQPALKAAVLWEGTDDATVARCFQRLEDQDPMLQVTHVRETKEITVRVMGKIQLEVLREWIQVHEGLTVQFGPCRVVYQETIAKPVMGYGHFEPLRHYAEVHLRLEPNPGGGVVFESELHVDELAQQHQHTIEHFALTRVHHGVLTGSPLTDVRIVLTKGAVHLKHTHGGDLREATYRGIRQGLEKAESVLLEPYYGFEIQVESGLGGRVLSDIAKRQGTASAEQAGGQVRITGSGPVKQFVDYPEILQSMTKGEGAVSMQFSGYRPCVDADLVIAEMGYDPARDMEQPSSSVFCAKGAGFEVKGRDAEAYMHLL